jgi:hypothetical protein
MEETMKDILQQLSDGKRKRLHRRSLYYDQAILILVARGLIETDHMGYHKRITNNGLLYLNSKLSYLDWLE